MKSTVMMAGLVALACSSLPAFAKVQRIGPGEREPDNFQHEVLLRSISS
ncbi:hypothetical protein [Burkholderia sp. AU16741]|nr:hypothetical protein [Burkholderia sp. AU16741]